MFGIGWTELVLLGGIALMVLGPEKLPAAARQMGRWLRELRAASVGLRDEFRSEFADDDVFGPRPGAAPREQAPPTADRRPGLAPPEDGFGRPVRRRRGDADDGEQAPPEDQA